MKTRTIIISLFLLFSTLLFNSCTTILMYQMGIRNPKIENKKSLTDACTKRGMRNDNLYCYKDSATFMKYMASGKVSSPEMDFYDKNGAMMLYKDNKKCVGQTDSLIDFLDPKKVIKLNEEQNIHNFINDLRTLDGKPLNPGEFQGYDYYLVIYWGKWGGKVGPNHILSWEKEINEKKDIKLKVIKVACDYMDFWHVDKKNLFKLYGRQNKVVSSKRKA